MQITFESPDQPEVRALIAELDAYQDSLYPAEARYALDIASLAQSQVLFAVARDSAAKAIGCGAIVLDGRTGELKRLFLKPEYRGNGIAEQLLYLLESRALASGCLEVLLETGPYSTQALHFYEKQGYHRRGAYGDYPEHPLSVFMSKTLATSATQFTASSIHSKMKIRMASASDAHSIAEIHTNSWRNNYQNTLSAQYLAEVVPQERRQIWENRFANPKTNQYVLVAEHDDVILGFACVYVDENAKWGAYLDNLHVHSDYQANGIGKSLMREVASRCYQQAPDTGMCLLVNQTNTNAQQFYQSLGARNAEVGVWNAPDGSVVPTYWFVWDTLDTLKKED